MAAASSAVRPLMAMQSSREIMEGGGAVSSGAASPSSDGSKSTASYGRQVAPDQFCSIDRGFYVLRSMGIGRPPIGGDRRFVCERGLQRPGQFLLGYRLLQD